MTVKLYAPEKLLPVKGVRLAAVAAGIKKNKSLDMVVIELVKGSVAAGVFTRNRFRAAPVVLCENHLEKTSPRLLMINSGNANAGTGETGMQNAIRTCELAAENLSCSVEEILPFSTGVIGQNLPVDCFKNALPVLIKSLEEDNWLLAARGIMTTDTVAKGISNQIELDGVVVTITGIAKGSGMIRPDMATMLGYVATDAVIEQSLLQQCLKEATDSSFNCITVDGDTSTNDSCILVATGQAGNACIDNENAGYVKFKAAITEVCQFLAQAIIRDAEGINRFVEIQVTGASTVEDARQVGYTVAHSPLVKTAIFAGDPNWGRILAAVGRAPVEVLDIDTLTIHLDDVCIVENGGRSESYTEEAGQRVMSQDEIRIRIDLAVGQAAATIWTSDLSYEYVKINAEYRT